MDLYKTKPPPLTEDINDVSDSLKDKFESNIVNRIDYPSEPDRFKLHCWHLFGTWILDEVSFDQKQMLFCVEGNSRYLKVLYPTEKGEAALTKAINMEKLEDLIQRLVNEINDEIRTENKRVRKVKYIIWDAAGTHDSPAMHYYLRNMKLAEWVINTSATPHGPMRVLDRTVKTIKDLVARYQKQHPSETEVVTFIEKIVDYYNRSPHATLEKMTHIRGMTPWNVHINEILERQIIRYCQSWNYNLKLNPHYQLKIGDRVLVKKIVSSTMGERKKQRDKYHDTIYSIDSIEDGHYKLNPPFLDMNQRPMKLPRAMLVKIKSDDAWQKSLKNRETRRKHRRK